MAKHIVEITFVAEVSTEVLEEWDSADPALYYEWITKLAEHIVHDSFVTLKEVGV